MLCEEIVPTGAVSCFGAVPSNADLELVSEQFIKSKAEIMEAKNSFISFNLNFERNESQDY
jgi:hypothetical protein